MLRRNQAVRSAWHAARACAGAIRMRAARLLGAKSHYGLPPGYRHRSAISYFDDLENEDDWQREVYEAARDIMRQEGLRTVCDVGCGSGYKLVHLLGEFDTLGIDLPETIETVRRTYPQRRWVAGSFERVELPRADLVICADVIEHVADPDALMRFLTGIAKHYVVLSTPDRDLVYDWRSPNRFGPPANRAHVREWTMAEFNRYVGRFLAIERHEISNRGQGTQMIVGRVRS